MLLKIALKLSNVFQQKKCLTLFFAKFCKILRRKFILVKSIEL